MTNDLTYAEKEVLEMVKTAKAIINNSKPPHNSGHTAELWRLHGQKYKSRISHYEFDGIYDLITGSIANFIQEKIEEAESYALDKDAYIKSREQYDFLSRKLAALKDEIMDLKNG